MSNAYAPDPTSFAGPRMRPAFLPDPAAGSATAIPPIIHFLATIGARSLAGINGLNGGNPGDAAAAAVNTPPMMPRSVGQAATAGPDAASAGAGPVPLPGAAPMPPAPPPAGAMPPSGFSWGDNPSDPNRALAFTGGALDQINDPRIIAALHSRLAPMPQMGDYLKGLTPFPQPNLKDERRHDLIAGLAGLLLGGAALGKVPGGAAAAGATAANSFQGGQGTADEDAAQRWQMDLGRRQAAFQAARQGAQDQNTQIETQIGDYDKAGASRASALRGIGPLYGDVLHADPSTPQGQQAIAAAYKDRMSPLVDQLAIAQKADATQAESLRALLPDAILAISRQSTPDGRSALANFYNAGFKRAGLGFELPTDPKALSGVSMNPDDLEKFTNAVLQPYALGEKVRNDVAQNALTARGQDVNQSIAGGHDATSIADANIHANAALGTASIQKGTSDTATRSLNIRQTAPLQRQVFGLGVQLDKAAQDHAKANAAMQSGVDAKGNRLTDAQIESYRQQGLAAYNRGQALRGQIDDLKGQITDIMGTAVPPANPAAAGSVTAGSPAPPHFSFTQPRVKGQFAGPPAKSTFKSASGWNVIVR